MACVDVDELVRENAQLRQRVAELETRLKEMHHRAGNNLMIIASLLSLEAEQTRLDCGSCPAVLNSQQRARAMAMVDTMLAQASGAEQVDMADYLARLTSLVVQGYSQAPNSVCLELRTDPLYLTAAKATQCGLIVHELLTNCLKHAFTDGRDRPIGQFARIGVELTVRDDRTAVLEVTDNGIGLPDVGAQREGKLGWQLVDTLVDQMSGTWQLVGQPGTRVTVQFPRT